MLTATRHNVTFKTSNSVFSYKSAFVFTITKSWKTSSLTRVRRFVMVKPEQLNSRNQQLRWLAAACWVWRKVPSNVWQFFSSFNYSHTAAATCTWRDRGQPSRSAWYTQSIMHAYLIRCGCGGTETMCCWV